jgi:chromosomal replication initiator protein
MIMIGRKERLDLAIQKAKNQLIQNGVNDLNFPKEVIAEEKKSALPLSKMNLLLGKSSIADSRQGSILKRTGVANRPTYDLISDSNLGVESRGYKPVINLQSHDADYAGIAARRIKSLREKSLQAAEEAVTNQDAEDSYVGIESDSRPVWLSVLDGQRGRVISSLPDELEPVDEDSIYHHSRSLNVKAAWPKPLNIDTQRTFKQWFVCPENLHASRACESIVDSPATNLNPLIILGESGTGRSHLIHATAQGIARRMEGLVFLISAVDLIGMETLPANWQEALIGASLLAIDDAHIIADDELLANQIGQMVDHAINLGVHVILTSLESPDDWPSSRLWDICRNSAQTIIQNPTASSLVMFTRRLAGSRNLMLDDGQMASIVTFNRISWRSTIANFDKIALAIESGDDIIDGEDVIHALSGHSMSKEIEENEIVRDDVDNIATRLISNAVDTVYSDHDIGGIDLKREIPQLDDDDYSPPHWDANEMVVESDEMLEKYVHTSLDELTPEAPSVLSVNENDQHLIARPNRIEEKDYGRAADILTEIDVMIDDKISENEMEVFNNSELLSDLEEKMYQLAQKADGADIEELIQIADELRYLEEKLVAIDPEREPLPPFEEDEKPRRIVKRRKGKSKRKVTRRAPIKKQVEKEESFEESLDSFEPEGEWNIEAEDVDMNDLLDDTANQDDLQENDVAEKIVRVIKTPVVEVEDIVDAPPQLKLHISGHNSGEEE